MTHPEHRILTLSSASEWRAAMRHQGNRLVVTNGCFDVLTPGHVASLYAAAAEGDALLVLLNSDASVRALKGDGRPIHDQQGRALVLASLRCVAAVVIFEGTDCAAELWHLEPEAYVKSGEYRGCQNPAEAAALDHCGTEIIWLDRDERYSSSAAIDAAGGRGAVAPADPPGMVAPAGSAEYSRVAAAPVGRASTPEASGCVEIPRGGDWGVP